MLGVHPNTVRAWTDQGRLRCLRINARGDRRYRATDLRGFLDDARHRGTHTPFQARFRETAETPAASVGEPPTESVELFATARPIDLEVAGLSRLTGGVSAGQDL